MHDYRRSAQGVVAGQGGEGRLVCWRFGAMLLSFRGSLRPSTRTSMQPGNRAPVRHDSVPGLAVTLFI
jgi:hypothetical protein